MLAFCWRDALILLHQRRGSLHPMELLWASTVLLVVVFRHIQLSL